VPFSVSFYPNAGGFSPCSSHFELGVLIAFDWSKKRPYFLNDVAIYNNFRLLGKVAYRFFRCPALIEHFVVFAKLISFPNLMIWKNLAKQALHAFDSCVLDRVLASTVLLESIQTLRVNEFLMSRDSFALIDEITSTRTASSVRFMRNQ